MKTKRTMKSIAAAALALSLVALPAAQNAALNGGFSFGILANAATDCTTPEAFAAALSGTYSATDKTITLSGDVTLADIVKYTGDDDFTLDIGIHTIQGNSNVATVIDIASGNVTVTAEDGGTISKVRAYGTGTLNLNGGQINRAVVMDDTATINIDGATVGTSNIDDAFTGNGARGGNVNIKSGIVKGRIPVYGNIVVDGGVVDGCFYMWGNSTTSTGGSLVVNGGTLTSGGQDGGAMFSMFNDVHADVKAYAISPTITVTGGTINGSVNLWDGTDFEMTGGKIIYSGSTSGAINTNGSVGQTGSTITLSGGEVECTGNSAVYLPSGELTVSGDAKLKGDSAVIARSGKVTVEGGTLTAVGNAGAPGYDPVSNDGAIATGNAVVIIDSNYPEGVPDVSITGGTIECEHGYPVVSAIDGSRKPTGDPVTGFITGGVFESKDNTDLPDNLINTNAGYIKVTTEDGDELTVIGTEEKINQFIADPANKVEEVEVKKNVDEITVPEGVKVTNTTGDDITVNGVVIDGETTGSVDALDKTKFGAEIPAVPGNCTDTGTIAYYIYDNDTTLLYVKNADGNFEKVDSIDDGETVATDHDYTGKTPVFTWTGFDCTASVECTRNSAHKATSECTVSSAVTTPATTEATGVRTYTATVVFKGVTYTDTKTETIAKLPESDSAKLELVKTDVANALKGITAANDTTQAAVKAVVDKAVADSGVTGVTATTTFTLTAATEEAAGTAKATVALSLGEATGTVEQSYTIAKLPATTKPDDENKPGDDENKPGDGENKPGDDENKPGTDAAASLDKAQTAIETGWWAGATQDWITKDTLSSSYESIKNWLLQVLPEGVEITNINGNIKDSSTGETLFTVTVKSGDKSKDITFTMFIKGEEAAAPAPVVTYYSVGITGDYAGSGITVSSLSNTAGSAVTVNVPVGYEVSVVSGGNRIAVISDGTGTFTMPAGNVTLKVTSYLGTLTSGYKNAYIYSYDSGMNHIRTNSVRGGMTSPEGEVTVKLGSEYAGKSVTLYNGRKSTSSKVDEAVLDSNGQAVFSVKSGKNYTLVVE